MSAPGAIGRFIVLEGGEATGKSTQSKRLAARLRDEGIEEVVETFEPGGTALGAQLRMLFLHGDAPIDPLAEALLVAADRAQHVAEVVRPALARGAWVVSDRFVPSSLAYQGVGRGLGVPEVEQLNALATAGIEPDVVIVLDVPPAAASRRLSGARDRLEDEDDAFHLAVYEAYRDLAETRGWSLVDASGTVGDVAGAVWDIVSEEAQP